MKKLVLNNDTDKRQAVKLKCSGILLFYFSVKICRSCSLLLKPGVQLRRAEISTGDRGDQGEIKGDKVVVVVVQCE